MYLCMYVHIAPLTLTHSHPHRYHHNAYFAQQVGVVVRREDPTKFVDYVQVMFDQQDSKHTTAVHLQPGKTATLDCVMQL